jgi:hypothetical protein
MGRSYGLLSSSKPSATRSFRIAPAGSTRCARESEQSSLLTLRWGEPDSNHRSRCCTGRRRDQWNHLRSGPRSRGSTWGPSRGRSVPRRDRWFESGSLQRRVRLSPGAAFEVENPGFPRDLCAAALATGSAETHRVFQNSANWRQYLSSRPHIGVMRFDAGTSSLRGLMA